MKARIIQKLEASKLIISLLGMSCIEYKDYTEKYRLLEKLGNGNCAAVMKVEDRKTKKTYALKYAKFESPSQLAVAFQEIEVVRAVEHDTAIQVIFGLCRSITTSSKTTKLPPEK